ncbi:MAG: hypothetical protein R3270_02785 [Gammaproteobacteria bacterium]|nr:hypothetical protein [Gammaproteobacteria bacterium]
MRSCCLLLLLLLPTLATASDGEFTLTRLDGSNWGTSYCLDEPVQALRFERPIKDFREDYWSPDKGFELAFEEGAALLTRTDGEAFECATFAIRQFTQLPEKDYFPFATFSNGGVTVYTGHFVPSQRMGDGWQQLELDASFITRDGERVIGRNTGKLVEQFLYIGAQEPVKSDGLIAVIDPAMPEQARRNILDTIPVVNEMLADTFDFHPAEPYQLFMSTDLDAFDGFSSKGGALPGQMRFTLRGRGITGLLEEHPTHFSKTAAHEVLHLWQTDHWFSTLGNESPWVHEGSADALAFELMKDAGIWSSDEYAARWNATEADCRKGLEETSVTAAPDNGRFDVVYSCGAVFFRLVGERLDRDSPGTGIIRFWQAMAARPADARRVESRVQVFDALDQLGFSTEDRALLETFLDGQGEQALSATHTFRTKN